jgi:hypothetical protein
LCEALPKLLERLDLILAEQRLDFVKYFLHDTPALPAPLPELFAQLRGPLLIARFHRRAHFLPLGAKLLHALFVCGDDLVYLSDLLVVKVDLFAQPLDKPADRRTAPSSPAPAFTFPLPREILSKRRRGQR